MLRIHRVDGLLGIRTTRAELSIEQPRPEVDIRQKHAKVKIHTEQPRITIDQQQCFNESGLMSPQALLEDMAQRNQQAAIEGIARRVDEGNSLAAIESGGKPIPEISFSNSFDNKEFNMVTMPRSRPRIEVLGGTVDIRVDEGDVSISARTYNPKVDVKLGDVEIFLRQQPSMSFEFVDNKIDTKV